MKTVTGDTSAASVARTALVVASVVAVFVLGAFVLVKAYQVALALFAAIVLGEALRPVADRLAKHMSRPLSVSLAVLAFAVVAILAVFIPFDVLSRDLRSLLRSAPDYFAQLAALLQPWLGDGLRDRLTGALAANAASIGRGVIGFESALASAISIAILVILMAAFWLFSSDQLRAALLARIPASRRAQAGDLFDRMGSTLGSYVGGVVVNGAIVALGSSIILMILHAPHPLVLGLLQGALVSIPYLGTLVAVVTAGAVVLVAQGWARAAEAVALLSLMEGLEGSFIAPLVYKKNMNLDPLATLVATAVGAALFGIVGAVLAVPAAALLQTLIGAAPEEPES